MPTFRAVVAAADLPRLPSAVGRVNAAPLLGRPPGRFLLRAAHVLAGDAVSRPVLLDFEDMPERLPGWSACPYPAADFSFLLDLTPEP